MYVGNLSKGFPVRVCIVGDTTEPLDEGMKKTTYHVAKAVAPYCDVMVLNPFDTFGRKFWLSLTHFRPDIIHSITGPTYRSFVLLAIAKTMTSAKSVMSLIHPKPALPKKLISHFLKPDLLLAQSAQTAQIFQILGRNIEYVPNGVDIEKFHPIDKNEKNKLRLKYRLTADQFVVLHVGNTRKIRNLDVLSSLQRDGCQIVVISSTTISGDARVNERLRNSGCQVWQQYNHAIEEVYALADCYVFPTTNSSGAIEHPLSVMEAMACNLPVVTKRFRALPELFAAGEGLYFVDSDDEMREKVKDVRQNEKPISTRSKVLKFSWNDIGRQIFSLYGNLLSTDEENLPKLDKVP